MVLLPRHLCGAVRGPPEEPGDIGEAVLVCQASCVSDEGGFDEGNTLAWGTGGGVVRPFGRHAIIGAAKRVHWPPRVSFSARNRSNSVSRMSTHRPTRIAESLPSRTRSYRADRESPTLRAASEARKSVV